MKKINKIISYLPLQFALITSAILFFGLVLDETNILDGDAGFFIYFPLFIFLIWQSATKGYKSDIKIKGAISQRPIVTSLIASLILFLNPQFWIISSGTPPVAGVYVIPVFFISFFLISIFAKKRVVKSSKIVPYS